MQLDSLIPLSVPVPPMLEEALGYNGSARLVSFYWESISDKALFDDGVVSADAERTAYLGLLEHPTFAAQVRACELESLEQEARQWLVLDREARILSALPAQEAAALLSQQWGTRPATLPLQWETLDPIPQLLTTLTGKRSWGVVWMDGAPVRKPGQEQEAQVEALCSWLNQQQEARE